MQWLASGVGRKAIYVSGSESIGSKRTCYPESRWKRRGSVQDVIMAAKSIEASSINSGILVFSSLRASHVLPIFLTSIPFPVYVRISQVSNGFMVKWSNKSSYNFWNQLVSFFFFSFLKKIKIIFFGNKIIRIRKESSLLF